MKKLSAILVGLGLVAGSAIAANPVTSVNMVGFQNVSVPSNGWVMLSLNWNRVGGGNTIPINTLLSGTPLKAGPDFTTADKIFAWDTTLNAGAGGYKTYYLWDGDGLWYELLNDALPTTNVITRGMGLWLKHEAASTNFTVSGEVPVGSTNVVIFGALKWYMFGSSYTAGMAINGSNQTWQGNAGPDFTSADNIFAWDTTLNAGAGGYKTYYLWNGDGLWYEVLNDVFPTTNGLPLSGGAWFKNKGPAATTWIEVRPYTP